MTIELISLDELLPLEGNSKKHDTENTIKSIMEYGYRDYIEIDTVFNPPRIVCGHDRRNALLELRKRDLPVEGIQVVGNTWMIPCIVYKSATEQDAIRYSIDNNLSTIKGANLPLEDELKLFDDDLIKEQLSQVDSVVGWHEDDIEAVLNDFLEFSNNNESNNNNEDEDDINESVNESKTQEIDPDEYEFDCKCPKCGFEFNND